MKEILLIAKKDLKSYFSSPVAYILLASFLFLLGWFFWNFFSRYQFALSMGYGERPNLNDNVVRPLFGNMNVILLFLVPLVTMRLIAEERKDHTIELLLTAPIRPAQIVLGKFLAGLGLLLVMVGLSLFYPLILQLTSAPDWGVVGCCYLGMVLVSAAYSAVGLFWSARTENQIVAAVLTFGTLLFFWLISWAADSAGPIWGEVLTYLSLIGHFSNFVQGVFDTSDLVFYLSFTGFVLFLTYLSLEREAA